MTSLSQKSESSSKPLPRLSRTLKRKPSIRLITKDDFKYIWASYRLSQKDHEGLDKFKLALDSYLSSRDIIWILESVTSKGRIPVGYLSGEFVGPMLHLDEVQWFNWASKRNKVECSVAGLNEIRKTYVALFLSPMKDKEFFVHIARHGIIRRVGTINDVFVDAPAALFQTRLQ